LKDAARQHHRPTRHKASPTTRSHAGNPCKPWTGGRPRPLRRGSISVVNAVLAELRQEIDRVGGEGHPGAPYAISVRPSTKPRPAVRPATPGARTRGRAAHWTRTTPRRRPILGGAVQLDSRDSRRERSTLEPVGARAVLSGAPTLEPAGSYLTRSSPASTARRSSGSGGRTKSPGADHSQGRRSPRAPRAFRSPH